MNTNFKKKNSFHKPVKHIADMTDNLFTFSLTVFTGFFAIMNPIANTPIFLGLVEGEDQLTRKKIARTASFTAFVIVVLFVIIGKYLFQLFGRLLK